jgi:ABC-type transport system involved in multi-copper enzyme maturation permease subunit
VIRFAWLQSRIPVLVGVGGLAVVAIVLAVTGLHLVHLYDTTVATCSANCSSARSAFANNDRALQIGVDALVVVVPGIVGLLWGAPLVAREFETGTWRLAWTQSVTRARWLAAKVSVLGLASVVVSGLLGLMVTWWSNPIDHANMTRYATFEQRDIVSLGYAAFAFVLAVTAGVLIRRSVPAIASALAVFVAVRIVVAHWVRPNLITPAHQDLAINYNSGAWSYGTTTGLFGSGGPSTLMPPTPSIPNAWLYPTQLVDKAGHPLTSQLVARMCPTLGVGGRGGGAGGAGLGGGTTHTRSLGQGLQDCVTKIGATYHEVVTYQPASHYWPLQWYELAIYFAAAAALGAFCLWWVARRIG